MRRTAAAFALGIALAGCTAAPDPRGVERDEVLLQVVATGRTDMRPDEARFTAGVQTNAPTAAAASAGNNAVMNKVTAALEQLGVKPDDVQTRQISLQRIDYGPERGRFRADNMIEVRVRDLHRAGDAIAAATQAGANIVSGPNLTVSDPEAASRSAYAVAYKAARARAETYAKAAGLRVARVLTIRDTGETGGPIPYGGGMAVDAVAQTAAPPPPPVRAGLTTSEVRVRADFALAE
jgi:uncharacterized protein